MPHKKRESFIVIHWLVQNAKLKRREEKSGHSWVQMLSRGETPMAFVRAALNCLKEGLTQSIKLSEIVWKFQKPYGLQTFASFLCGWTHLFQYGEPQESSHAPLSLVTSGWMAHLSSAFMLYAGNYSFTREQKGLYSPGETGPKLGVFVSFFSFFSPAPQICVSHINFAQNGKTHVVGSKAKSRYCKVKERAE